IDKHLFKLYNRLIEISQYLSPMAGGWCIFCTKRLFERVHGFDEKLVIGEDYDFSKRVAKLVKLRVFKKSKIKLSQRRLIKDGRLKFIMRAIAIEVHTMFKGKIKEDIFNYEFGNFNDLDEAEKKKLFAKEKEFLDRKLKEVEEVYESITQDIKDKQKKLQKRFRKLLK
ncbi:hypothetical protein JXC34_03900, partial [Candidatus Woesearchaeota archaeon]|nr:hypothetical protein [Candidatus Woesearchaeota archaeon]